MNCFKAYDIRGRVPDELNEDIAYRIGRAYVEFLKPARVIVGRDIRLSSKPPAALHPYGDLSVSGQITDLLHEIRPDEIYHLGAQSHLRVSFDMPEYTGDVTGLGTLRLLGNLEAKRDWGFAGDYVEAMWLILQQETPDDFVIATGETHSVREFAEKVFAKLDLDYHEHVATDPRYFRPTEVDVLLGDATKARKALGWQPKVSFDQLIAMMVAADLEIAEKEKTLVNAGFASGGHQRG